MASQSVAECRRIEQDRHLGGMGVVQVVCVHDGSRVARTSLGSGDAITVRGSKNVVAAVGRGRGEARRLGGDTCWIRAEKLRERAVGG